MWVARDENGDLFLYEFKPSKREIYGTWYDWDDGDRYGIIQMDSSLFPTVKWEDDEPIEVDITAKKHPKKKLKESDKIKAPISLTDDDIYHFHKCSPTFDEWVAAGIRLGFGDSEDDFEYYEYEWMRGDFDYTRD